MNTSSTHQPGAPGSLTRQHFQTLVLSVGLTDLSDRERGFLAWLAESDQPTVETATGLFAKLVRPATDERVELALGRDYERGLREKPVES